MSEDLEPIPLERPQSTATAAAGSEPASRPSRPSRQPRRPVVAALVVAIAAGLTGWRLSAGDGPPAQPRPTGEPATSPSAAAAGTDVAYPAVRGVPPHLSTFDEVLVTRRNPGEAGMLVLVDSSGRVVWDLPTVAGWEPTAGAWSPDGRRFLFSASRGQETVARVVMLPEGVDLTVAGALAWIGENELLVWRAGRLGRLDVVSSELVPGGPHTDHVSAQAGSRGQAALVVLAGADAPRPRRTVVRFVDHALGTRDAPAPAGIVDCFSPTWHDDASRLFLACKRFDPPGTAAFEVDAATLRWRLLQTGSLQPAAVHPVLDEQALLVETIGNCDDDPMDLWLVRGTDTMPLRLNRIDTGSLAETDVAPGSAMVAAVSGPCGRTPHVVVLSPVDGSGRDLTPGRRPLWSPARRR